MRNRPISRRRLLALCGAGLATGILGAKGAFAQGAPGGDPAGAGRALRIGMVLPVPVGGRRVGAATLELAGEGARRGAVMAEEEFGLLASRRQQKLEVLISSAPDADAASRAGQRLAGTEEAFALVGGFDEAQALALSQVAEERRSVFINIGSASEALRSKRCGGHTFHVEATASAYLAALIGAHAALGSRRWFLLYADDDEGRALYQSAQTILAKQGDGHVEAGAEAIADPSDHLAAFEAIRQTGAESVLMLLDWRAQLDFLGHYEAEGLPQTVSGFPYPVTQTRDFLASLVRAAPRSGVAKRISLWEAAGGSSGAAKLGQDYLARWGVPMDPPAWAAYVAVGMLVEAALQTDSLQPSALAPELERVAIGMDLYKGADTYFRQGDHQLQQPLYLIGLDPAARSPSGVVRLAEELPANFGRGAGGDETVSGSNESSC